MHNKQISPSWQVNLNAGQIDYFEICIESFLYPHTVACMDLQVK